MVSPQHKIIIIAGPNGAGKTTFANEFLPNEADCLNFVNADLIAAGISPYSPSSVAFKAGRMMLQEIDGYIANKESFAFETTLSSRHYAVRIPEWQNEGYKVVLVFLKLDSVDTAIARVEQRVLDGGHNIPEDVIRRRYQSGFQNFRNLYCPIVDEWRLYDNSDLSPVLLDEGVNV